MLPTNRRVKKESFAKIMKEGTLVRTNNFYLRFLPQNNSILPQFGFVVPNKVKKTSVGRHLIKRKMTAVIERNQFNIKNNLAIIIFVQKDITTLVFSEIEKEILELLRRAKILI
jgi:ribonuclease P protein component